MTTMTTRELTTPNDRPFAEAIDGVINSLLALPGAATTELLLVRNAETECAAATAGLEDGPALSERGRYQASRLAARLSRIELDAVYCSTSGSALETAAFVTADRDLRVVQVHELRDIELHPAALNGAGRDRLRLEAEMRIRFANNPRWDALRGVEPTRSFRHRTIQAIEAVAALNEGSRVVVVTHQANINAYLSMVLGIERDMFFHAEFTSISTVRIQRDLYGVQGINDHAHLSSN